MDPDEAQAGPSGDRGGPLSQSHTGQAQAQSGSSSQAQAGPAQAQPQVNLATVAPATREQLTVLADKGYRLFDGMMFAKSVDQVTALVQGMHLNQYQDPSMNLATWQVDTGGNQGLHKAMQQSIKHGWDVGQLESQDCNTTPVHAALGAFGRGTAFPPFQCYSWVQSGEFPAEKAKWSTRRCPATSAEVQIAYSRVGNAIVVLKATSLMAVMQDQLERHAVPKWFKDPTHRRNIKVEDEMPVPRVHSVSDVMAATIQTVYQRQAEPDAPVSNHKQPHSGSRPHPLLAKLDIIVYQSVQDSGDHMHVIKAILAAAGQSLSPWPGLQIDIGNWAFDALLATEKFQDVAWLFAQRRSAFQNRARAAHRVHIFSGAGDAAGVPSLLWAISPATLDMVADAAQRHSVGVQGVVSGGGLGGDLSGQADNSHRAVRATSYSGRQSYQSQGYSGSNTESRPDDTLPPEDRGKRPATDQSPSPRFGVPPDQRQGGVAGSASSAGPQSGQAPGQGGSTTGSGTQGQPASGFGHAAAGNPGGNEQPDESERKHTSFLTGDQR